MEEKEKSIRLPVHMETSKLLDGLVAFVEEQESVPRGLQTTRVSNTYLLQTEQRLWARRTERDGCCSLSMETLSVDEEYRDVEAVYWRKREDKASGETVIQEDREAEPRFRAFRAKERHEARAMLIALRAWGQGRTQLVARWWQPEGETWVKRLLSEVATYRPEVRSELAQLGIPLAGEGPSGQGARVEPEKRPSWFPKTVKTQELWQTRWELMCTLDVKARDLYQAGKRDDVGPSPTWSEYIRILALTDGTGKAMKERTVRYIKEAGEKGFLT